jgi:predicted RNA-binding protein YlqC (UPF0109 family)
MEDTARIADALKNLVKLMVDKPDEVSIVVTATPSGVMYRLAVASTDTGKLIGKQGRTARSLRVVLSAMAMTAKVNIDLDIVDRGDSTPVILTSPSPALTSLRVSTPRESPQSAFPRPNTVDARKFRSRPGLDRKQE